MKTLIRKTTLPFGAIIAAFILLIACSIVVIASHAGAVSDTPPAQGSHLVTIHDGGNQTVISTHAATVGDALKEAGVAVDKRDNVEPAISEKLVASEYQVNIYRARPVVVVDGAVKQKIITPFQTASQIAASAGITLYPEDTTTLSRTDNIVSEGTGLLLTIKRAIPFTMTLYGTTTTMRTQGKTVGDMLQEKNITLSKDDRVSVDQSTPITSGMSVQVWREGKQTITQTEPVPFTTQQIQDADQPVGYKQVQTAGVNGSKLVTYELMIIDGKEASRTQISSVTTQAATTQVEVVGIKLVLMQGYSAQRVQIMSAAGVAASDQGYAAYILDHENASWCPTRWQGTAGCPASFNPIYSVSDQVGYGLCQATPGIKMASAGADWQTNPVTQMQWCSSYAVGRYGSWSAAYSHWVGHHNW